MTERSHSGVESEVLRIRGMIQEGRFPDALAAGQTLLERVPENRDVLYMVAVSQRYLKRVPEALQTLSRCEEMHPLYSRLFQERGHCCLAAGDPGGALDAFLHAVSLNAALPASWNALSVLFKSAGRSEESADAARQSARLARLPKPVVTAWSVFADGDVLESERIVRAFLLKHPNDIEGMRLLAHIGMKLEVLDDAEFLLESVLAFAPDYHLARFDYATVLLRRHQHVKAQQQVAMLLRVEPQNRSYRTLQANLWVALGKSDLALDAFRELLTDAPRAADIHLSMAHALKTIGRQNDAIISYRNAAAAAPGFGDAYWSLANLKTYRFADAEIAQMRREEARSGAATTDRYHLCFALGKALEDAAEYEESFAYYERGNALKHAEVRYRPEFAERNTRMQSEVCTGEFFGARRGVGCDRPDPIFIVGLPRAGSTLIEQILASHSQVQGTMELADIPRLVHSLQGRESADGSSRYPGILRTMQPEDFQRLGEKYLYDTQVYRTGKSPHDATGDPESTPYFIDKMPNNFRHIGLIHLMLPNARIIDARREPMACCFSNFKQLFATGQEFTYSLEDIGRYYRTYVELMNHWDRVLPGKILRVNHEDVVADLEHSVRRLLDFCGLAFEPACLEFYKNERSVRTASSEQVRRPIYTDGLDQWRHYEEWLQPLRQALAPMMPA